MKNNPKRKAKVHITTQRLPSGIVVASIGTQSEICFSRPWQSKLTEDKPKWCVFDGSSLGDKAQRFPHICKNWLAVDNVRKTGGVNKLIMPNNCWDESEIQRLGGAQEIEKAFTIAACLEPQVNMDGLLFLVQIGLHGGASMPWHLHYQLQTLEEENNHGGLEKFFSEIGKSTLVIRQTSEWRATLGGRYAGQCFFLPEAPPKICDQRAIHALSAFVSDIVDLYNFKFVSKEGLPPNFSIAFVIDGDGSIRYGSNKPVLYHQWG
ncbi:MAG: hypothetical protein Q7R65_04555, partial [bacterium]|nr:hypothetical protein [bacterium]